MQPLMNLEVRIDSFATHKDHTEYAVSVKTRISMYTVSRRYSEFYQLDQMLRKRYPQKTWPRLPEWLLFGNTNRDKLELRRIKLFDYLATVVAIYAREPSIKEVANFIELRPEEARKLMDVNAANLYLNNKCMVAYLGLIYARGDIRRPLAEFAAAAMRTRVPRPVAQAILVGEGAVQSIFAYAFCTPALSEAEMARVPTSLFSARSGDAPQQPSSLPFAGGEFFPHYRCTVVSGVIIALFDLVGCLNAETFRAVLCTLRVHTWLGSFQEHAQAPSNTACKANCYRLIRIFLELNNFFDITEVFTSEAERDRFLCWMKAVTPRSAGLKEQEALQTPFPRMESIIRDDGIAVEFLDKTLARFSSKDNLDTVAHNMYIHFSRFSFLIDYTRMEEFVQTMRDFRWSANKLDIRSELQEQSAGHLYDRMVYFHRRNAHTIVTNVWNIYRVQAGEKTILVFVTEEAEPQLQQAYYDRFLEENPRARSNQLVVSENNTGVFVEIERSREDPTKLLASILIAYGFRSISGEVYYANFRSMTRTMKNIKKYYDAFLARGP